MIDKFNSTAAQLASEALIGASDTAVASHVGGYDRTFRAKVRDEIKRGERWGIAPQNKTQTAFGMVGLIAREVPAQDRPRQVLSGARYCIVRNYYTSHAKIDRSVVIRGGLLSADDARGIVKGAEHSSLTCKRREGRKHTKENGAWYDTWRLEGASDRAPIVEKPRPMTVDEAIAALTKAQKGDRDYYVKKGAQ